MRTIFAAVIVGVVTFVATFGVSITMALYRDFLYLGDEAAEALDLVSRISEENNRVLGALSAVRGESARVSTRQNNCASDALAAYRNLLLDTVFVRDILVLNGNDVSCTAALGEVYEKDVLSRADYRSPEGYDIWLETVVPGLDIGRVATVSRKGAFALSMNPSVLRDLRIDGGTITTYFQEDGRFITGRGAEDFKQMGLLAQGNGIDFTSYRLFVNTCSEAGYPCVLVTRDFDYLLVRSIPKFILGAAFAMVISLFAAAWVKRWARRRSSFAGMLPSLINDENVVVHFQPIVDLESERIVGAEALVRLRTEHELLYPDKFLDHVAEQDLTWQLTEAVVNRAVRDLSELMRGALSLSLNFNFFPQDLNHDKIDGLFKQVGRDHPEVCSALKMRIEVTEHQVLDKAMLGDLDAFASSPYDLVLDDFGTGYSNLAQVKRLCPSFLKIDKSFVADMSDGAFRSSLVAHVVPFARAAGAQVVAEGVENAEQIDMLRDLGVQYGQGYYFGRPVDAVSFMALVLRNRFTIDDAGIGETSSKKPAKLKLVM